SESAFRRPETARFAAEDRGMLFDSESYLRRCVCRPGEPFGKCPAGHRPFGKLRVIKERQDGMKKRRRRELRLPTIGSVAITLQNETHCLELQIQHPLLLLLSEPAALRFEFLQLGM